MTTRIYQLETIHCPSCIAKIGGMLKRTEGIQASEVLFNSSRVRVDFNETRVSSETIRGNIASLGYHVLGEK
jgi:copper chaperone CopZ